MPKYDVLRDAKKYIEAFLCIKTKESEIVPFRLNSAQNRLYECCGVLSMVRSTLGRLGRSG